MVEPKLWTYDIGLNDRLYATKRSIHLRGGRCFELLYLLLNLPLSFFWYKRVKAFLLKVEKGRSEVDLLFFRYIPMNKLIEKVLTDRGSRDAEAMKAYLANVADVGEPWVS